MNTDGLAKHYDKLTPWERVPLLIAARARRDEAEFARLKSSAPMKCFEIPDYADFIDRLSKLADWQMMRQLDLTAWYWQVSAMHADHCWSQDDENNDPVGDRIRSLERLAAYCFLVNADAWQQFCEELGIDPEALLRDGPGYDTIKQMEEDARQFACSAAEAAAFVRQRNSEAEARTIEDTVQVIRKYIQAVGGSEIAER